MDIKAVEFSHHTDYSEGVFQLSDMWVSAGDMRTMQRMIVFDYWVEVDPEGPGTDEWVLDGFMVHQDRFIIRIEPKTLCGREAA